MNGVAAVNADGVDTWPTVDHIGVTVGPGDRSHDPQGDGDATVYVGFDAVIAVARSDDVDAVPAVDAVRPGAARDHVGGIPSDRRVDLGIEDVVLAARAVVGACHVQVGGNPNRLVGVVGDVDAAAAAERV